MIMSLSKWSCFGIIYRRGIRMVLFLGIDGGGTGCRAAVADAAGRILGQGRAGPANLMSDPAGTRENLLAATRTALAEACGAGNVEAELPHLIAGLGLAGVNTAGEDAREKLDLPFAKIRLETDAMASVKGALGADDGIVAAMGTGTVFASQRNGVIRQIGGWGLILGDEGSGAALGRALLARALRAVDGFVPMTPLLAAVVTDHGDPAGIVDFARTARPADFAALAPRVIAASDPAAVAIMQDASSEVAAAVTLLQADGVVPLVFIGGLGPAYANIFADRWEICAPKGTALDGALILAREMA
jgi:glucosamine kinase